MQAPAIPTALIVTRPARPTSGRGGWIAPPLATIELDAPSERPRFGDKVEFIAAYSDSTVHLHEEMGVRRGRVEAVWRVAGSSKSEQDVVRDGEDEPATLFARRGSVQADRAFDISCAAEVSVM